MAAVIAAAFGIFLVCNIISLMLGEADEPATVSESGMWVNVAIELVIGAVVWFGLHRRGWTFQAIGLGRPDRRDPVQGIGLAVVCWVLDLLLLTAAGAIFPGLLTGGVETSGPLSLSAVLLVSLVNPIYEEIFVCAYVIEATRRHGEWTWWGIAISAALRLAYHMYQGPSGMAFIMPFGLLCAIWYARTSRLWPLVIAHGLLDLVGLTLLSGQ